MVESVPTLDEIARDPRRVADLPDGAVTALLLRTAVVQSALSARLAQLGADAAASSCTLDADEIAHAMGVSRRWVFRNAKRLSFVRRVSRKSLVGDEAGLRRWLATRRAV